MDKRGVKFLGEHVVNIIIAVLVVVILVYLGYKMVTIWSDGNKLERAGEALEEIVSKINVVNVEGVEGKIVVFPPENWYLRTFSDYDFPIGECFKASDCLCVCNDIRCEDSKKCEGFDFNVMVDGEISKFAGGNAAGVAVVRYPGLKLESSEEIFIVKEEGVVKVGRVENGA